MKIRLLLLCALASTFLISSVASAVRIIANPGGRDGEVRLRFDRDAQGGHPNEHLSKNIKKLELSDQDKQDLVAFMAEGLLSSFPQVETGRLPQ